MKHSRIASGAVPKKLHPSKNHAALAQEKSPPISNCNKLNSISESQPINKNSFAQFSLSNLEPVFAELKQEIQSSGAEIFARALDFVKNTLANPSCPPWAHMIGEKLIQAGLPVATVESYSKMTPYDYGRAHGFLFSSLSCMQQESLAASNDATGLKIQLKCALVIPKIMQILERESANPRGASLKDLAEYARGLNEILKLTKDSPTNLMPGHTRLDVYLLLLCGWQQVEQFNTRKEIYEWLETHLTHNCIMQELTFYRLCDEIHLKVAKRGRPRKITNA